MRLPLVLMNSFATRDDSLEALSRIDGLASDVPADFVQRKEPKIVADDGAPVVVAGRPGARVGAARARRRLPVARRLGDARRAPGARLPLPRSCRTPTTSARCSTRASSPGSRARRSRSCRRSPTAPRPTARAAISRGARRTAGWCCARSAQVPDDDADAFQDIARHTFFNTNNLWVDLRALQAVHGGARAACIGPADDRQPQDRRPERLRLDRRSCSWRPRWARRSASSTAPGAARAADPVRAGEDDQRPARAALGRIRADGRPRRRAGREPGATRRSSTLDDAYYKLLRDFEERFAAGAPSLVEAERLKVVGRRHASARAWWCKGSVTVEGPSVLDDGTVLEG